MVHNLCVYLLRATRKKIMGIVKRAIPVLCH